MKKVKNVFLIISSSLLSFLIVSAVYIFTTTYDFVPQHISPMGFRLVLALPLTTIISAILLRRSTKQQFIIFTVLSNIISYLLWLITVIFNDYGYTLWLYERQNMSYSFSEYLSDKENFNIVRFLIGNEALLAVGICVVLISLLYVIKKRQK